MRDQVRVVPFERLRMTDVESVGGKNASLGEMISQLAGSGVRVPGGFATTAQAYRDFLAHEGLADRIAAALDKLDIDDVEALVKVGAQVRQMGTGTPFDGMPVSALLHDDAKDDGDTGWWFHIDFTAVPAT